MEMLPIIDTLDHFIRISSSVVFILLCVLLEVETLYEGHVVLEALIATEKPGHDTNDDRGVASNFTKDALNCSDCPDYLVFLTALHYNQLKIAKFIILNHFTSVKVVADQFQVNIEYGLPSQQLWQESQSTQVNELLMEEIDVIFDNRELFDHAHCFKQT